LLDGAIDSYNLAGLRASQRETSGAWLQALPLSSVGLKTIDDVVRVAVGIRLGLNLCEPQTCTCGQQVDTRGTQGLACKRSASRYQRHGLQNVVWRAMQRTQVPSVKEPSNLCRAGRRPDGVTMIPWARGRCMAWDGKCQGRSHFVGGPQDCKVRRPLGNPHLRPPRLRDTWLVERASPAFCCRAQSAHLCGHRKHYRI